MATAASSVTLELDVPDVELWWPHDLGPQPLHDVRNVLSTDTHPRRLHPG
jgi:beta-mannosidase